MPDADAVARGLDQFQRRAEQAAGDGTFIAAVGQARCRREHEQRMAPTTIATRNSSPRSRAVCSIRHRCPRECRLVARDWRAWRIERW
jgi:hypothetical protein